MTPTLDRYKNFVDDDARHELLAKPLKELSLEATALHESRIPVVEGDGLELLARHHGLPSALLDWPRSPYVAAYFAYPYATGPEPAIVWNVDLDSIPLSTVGSDDFELIDDRSLLRFDRRAIQQQSLFIHVNTVRQPLEVLLISGISRVELDFGDRAVALADLDLTGLTASSLFDDMDGVARTVGVRLS